MNLLNTLLSSGLLCIRFFGVRAGLSISLCAIAVTATAQNLVPNWSFEDTAYCTTATNPILVAPPWYSANYATPDVYNADNSPCGVYMNPDEVIGQQCFQAPYDGERFAGEYFWSDGVLKEYMEVRLLDSLRAGHSYRVAMEINLPECYQYAVDELGAYFASDTVFDPTTPVPGALPHVPQARFHSPTFFVDESNWMHVEDTIVADGGERYMVIGTFTDNSSANSLFVGGEGWASDAYYYVDAVVVEEIIIGQGLSIHQLRASTIASGQMMLSWSGADMIGWLTIHDTHGRVIIRQYVADQRIVVSSTDNLPWGVYVVNVDNGTMRANAKWIKME